MMSNAAKRFDNQFEYPIYTIIFVVQQNYFQICI